MTRRSSRYLKGSAAGLLVLLAAGLVIGEFAGFGCASREKWLAQNPASRPIDTERLGGSWLGAWASTESDMGGELRARIVKIAEGQYQADFDAVFAKIFTSQQSVILKVDGKNGAWEFSGQADLGFLKGGMYTYKGHTDGTDFKCSYDSKFDKGTFQMKRLTGETKPTTGATQFK